MSNEKIPKWLLDELEDNPAVKLLDEENSDIPFNTVIQEALTIAASFQHRKRSLLVVKQNLYQAQRLYERISSFLSDEECALFASDESLRVEAIANSPEMQAIKVETMASLLENPHQVVITCPSALLRFLPQPSDFQNCVIDLSVGKEIDMDELKERLIKGGYTQTNHVDQPLSFASRGGIIDVYSINYENPIRIEFFDTEIDSIRFFDVTTQKTIQQIKEVKIVPASDVLFTDEQIEEICTKARKLLSEDTRNISGDIESDLTSLENHIFERKMYPFTALLDKASGIWEYMDHPTFIISDPTKVSESIKSLLDDSIAYIQEMVQEGKMLPKYSVYHDYSRIALDCKRVNEEPFMDNISMIGELHLPNEPLDIRLKMIHTPEKNVIALNEKELKKVIEICLDNKIPYQMIHADSELTQGINLYLSDYVQGFHIGTQLNVYTAAEIFELHHHRGRYENKFRSAEVLHHYEDLKPGDYIVHATYGVGQYIGIETREFQGVKRDFLKVVYRGNAELLVPLEQFRLVRKFVSREGVVPRLNKLGSGDWEKTKQKLQENVANIAERLISLYTNRETHIGYAFSKDTEEQKKFEDDFIYELTPDQKKAVEEIKKDMESDKPMDRLVCGDVGFGKTEVSVIASFKAVTDNKQVAMLCPTTILAEQHYHTYINRYKGYPVEIRVLDRYVSNSEVKKTLKDLEEGKVDIVVGTHRLLSKDIKFKDLGLLIVDEEQRFGVEHKERIKEMKNGIDVLTLSATPIPRTLQMSLVGIRQLSQLETPPMNRYSVQTYVVEKNDGLIQNAIEKELSRNGQVFYLYNNIEQIYNRMRKLQHLIPEAKIGCVHGQMGKEEIEDTMLRFNQHEIDVLVCTTIVENGIDVPNANTIMIEDAQNFGLAQIYQIKGRVGRSDRLAYAYLMIPQHRQLTEIAQKRLNAVKEFASLGSGYKIAMRDLTIRGAGDLLGPSQSGFIDTVGIDMYIEMLEEAIQAKKSGKEIEHQEIKPNTSIKKTSYIPDSFTNDDFDKLDMYQKFDALETEQQLKAYRLEIEDQYGKLPKEVKALFDKKELDIALKDPIVQSYREIRNQMEITFSSLYSQHVDGVKLFETFTKISKDITIRYANKCIIVLLPKSKNDLKMAVNCIQKAKESVHEN